MRKLYALFLFVLVGSAASAQQILLMSETFDNGPSGFYFDSLGVGTNRGNNDWVVNDSFAGQSVYPDTPPQDSVVSGQINSGGAPYSNYLHIRDVPAAAGSGPSNDNWNPGSASDRFTHIGNGFCTLGLDSVIFTFFWICEGDSNAYGQVYYRSGTGPWIQTGQAKYNQQSKWKYETIEDTAFNNVANLQFGFRWVNSVSGTRDVSFGIDDIIAVGNYDQNKHPVHMTLTVLDSQICQGDRVLFNLNFSQALCDGSYDMQLSDANGSFANFNDLGTYNFGPNFTSGSLLSTNVPGSLQGACFKLRIVRTGPAPILISDTSACFIIATCGNTVFNVQAPLMNDIDTACILSELNIQFNSTGIFNTGNQYVAELSDTAGSFTNPVILGQWATTASFPTGYGGIYGLLPATLSPACGYYIRVRSTNPAVISQLTGPFCVKQCDELTNNHTDVNYCIQSGPYHSCDTMRIHPHQWSNSAVYDTCNKWVVELRSLMDFSLANSGGLAVYRDSAGGLFTLCMPPVADSLPVPPGTYYMRIVSTCSNQPWNETGTVIRITIGAPNVTPPTITLNDSILCPGSLLDLTVAPFNYPFSDYQWTSNILYGGQPFTWAYDPLQVSLASAHVGSYVFYVREINNGCLGPVAESDSLHVISRPNVTISGPDSICLGDTVAYTVNFLPQTYYHWSGSGIDFVDQGNNSTRAVVTAAGTFNIGIFSLNMCGSDSGNFSIHAWNCVTGIKNGLAADAIAITPNPSKGELLLLGASERTMTEMFDLRGNRVFEAAAGQKILDISNLPDGVYLISVKTENNSYRQKVVLIR